MQKKIDATPPRPPPLIANFYKSSQNATDRYIAIVRILSSVGQNMDIWLVSQEYFYFSSKLPKQPREHQTFP